MGNLNKVMLIGRLTRDPEVRELDDGVKSACFGFAVNNRRRNPESGEWEDAPVWLELKTYSRPEGGRKLAEVAAKYLSKGRQVYVEGRLVLNEWQDRETGRKKSRLVIHASDIQLLEKKENGAGSKAASA